jgi:hypothetical protein
MAPEWFLGGSQGGSRASQEASRGSQAAPRCFPEALGWLPGGSQELLGTTWEAPGVPGSHLGAIRQSQEAPGSHLGAHGNHLAGSQSPWEPLRSNSGAI